MAESNLHIAPLGPEDIGRAGNAHPEPAPYPPTANGTRQPDAAKPSLPAAPSARPADTGIEAIQWIEATIMGFEGGGSSVEMTDIMLCWILRTARCRVLQQAMLKLDRVGSLSDDVILMEDVAEEVTVIENGDAILRKLRRQALDPIGRVARQRDIERHDFFDLARMDRAISYCSTGNREAVEHRGFRLSVGALKISSAIAGKVGVKQGASDGHTLPRNLDDEVVFVQVPVVPDARGEMIWKAGRDRLQQPIRGVCNADPT